MWSNVVPARQCVIVERLLNVAFPWLQPPPPLPHALLPLPWAPGRQRIRANLSPALHAQICQPLDQTRPHQTQEGIPVLHTHNPLSLPPSLPPFPSVAVSHRQLHTTGPPKGLVRTSAVWQGLCHVVGITGEGAAQVLPWGFGGRAMQHCLAVALGCMGG